MDTKKELQQIASMVASLEALNQNKEALVFFSLTDGGTANFYMDGKALFIQALLEDRYRNNPLFKKVIDRIVAGDSVLKRTGEV